MSLTSCPLRGSLHNHDHEKHGDGVLHLNSVIQLVGWVDTIAKYRNVSANELSSDAIELKKRKHPSAWNCIISLYFFGLSMENFCDVWDSLSQKAVTNEQTNRNAYWINIYYNGRCLVCTCRTPIKFTWEMTKLIISITNFWSVDACLWEFANRVTQKLKITMTKLTYFECSINEHS